MNCLIAWRYFRFTRYSWWNGANPLLHIQPKPPWKCEPIIGCIQMLSVHLSGSQIGSQLFILMNNSPPNLTSLGRSRDVQCLQVNLKKIKTCIAQSYFRCCWQKNPFQLSEYFSTHWTSYYKGNQQIIECPRWHLQCFHWTRRQSCYYH